MNLAKYLPNLSTMPKWKRRALMVPTFPLVLLEVNVNFLISAYMCWNAEKYIFSKG